LLFFLKKYIIKYVEFTYDLIDLIMNLQHLLYGDRKNMCKIMKSNISHL